MGRDSRSEGIWTPANVITMIRILLIPVFVVVLLSPWPSFVPNSGFWEFWKPWVAALVFVAISVTDAVDGHLARSRGEVTDFGKFLDPLADKILVCSALLALIELGVLHSWVALVIIAREFIVSGLRMVASAKGVVIAASMLGKVKTVLQMIAIVMFTVKDSLAVQMVGGLAAECFGIASWAVMLAALAMTVVSLADYLAKSRDILGLTRKR